MNDAEIMKEAEKALQEIEQELGIYQPLAWGMPWDIEAVEKMEKIISFYQERKRFWIKLLAGAGDVTREILIEFMRLADLEIEGAEGVLFMLQGEKGKNQSAN